MSMQHPFVILLDMDGVCCNFVDAAAYLLSQKWGKFPGHLVEWPKGEYDICKVYGIKPDEFWGLVDDEKESFWLNIQPYPWFKVLYSSLQNVIGSPSNGKIIFCSSPSYNAACVKGKLQWLQTHFGVGFRDYMLTPCKQVAAHPCSILIDDCFENVEAFKEAGGNGVLFPMPWNRAHEQYDENGGMIADVLHKVRSLLPRSQMSLTLMEGESNEG